ncbi:MAG: oligosaccharide flippase family protein [Treponema sp.]|nr:oligosaccharide flippase family protein [Treponema sp.]
MQLEKTKNTLRNAFWGFFNQIIQNLLPFFTRTLLIKLLGSEYLGLSSLFTSILQILNLAEAGFSQAIVFSMYKPIADDDDEKICALLSLYRFIYKIVGTVITVAGLCILPFLPRFINGTYPSDVNIYILYCIYLSNIVLNYFLFAYKQSLFSAFQREDKISKVASVLSIAQPLIQISLLFAYRNLIAYTIAIPLVTIVKNITIAILAKKQFPQYVCKGEISKNAKKSIYKKVAGLFIEKLSTTSRDSFDSIFISSFIGLASVTIYSNYFYIMNAIYGFFRIFIGGMNAGIGNAVASQSVEDNYKTFKTLSFLYSLIAGWCTICLFCLYQPFITLWLGNSFLFSFKEMTAMCAYFYVQTLTNIKGSYTAACGLWWENRYRAIIEAITNIILNYLFVRFFGIFGIIIATVISIVFINFGYGSSILFKNYFKSKAKLLYCFCTHLKYLATTALIAGILFFMGSLFSLENKMLDFILRICLCAVLPALLYYGVYYKTLQEESIQQLIKKILRRK